MNGKTKQIDDGGPAFPAWLKVGEIAKSDGGMSLRDYFAAQAMSLERWVGIETYDERAREAYKIADARAARSGIAFVGT